MIRDPGSTMSVGARLRHDGEGLVELGGRLPIEDGQGLQRYSP